MLFIDHFESLLYIQCHKVRKNERKWRKNAMYDNLQQLANLKVDIYDKQRQQQQQYCMNEFIHSCVYVKW